MGSEYYWRRKIKEKVLDHWLKLGYIVGDDSLKLPDTIDKSLIRNIYQSKRVEREESETKFLDENAHELIHNFANGDEVNPEHILPVLEEVDSGTWQSDLFRLATMLWSVPVSRGFGRRIRFLVWDTTTEKLIGVIALGDPVFNLKVRDDWIGWTTTDREKRLCHTLDAYILGSVPPYSALIGGKLVAALIASKEVTQIFHKRYGRKSGIISQEAKRPKLTFLTTTSALGRSSVYNRLKIGETFEFKSIGFTDGWGHFHISDDLFKDMKKYLEITQHPYATGYEYGDGPNWRIRLIREALKSVGFKRQHLNHGIQREVFAIPLASNFREILTGSAKRPKRNLLTSEEIGRFCVQRWMYPRSQRDDTYKSITCEQTYDRLMKNGIIQ